MRCLETAFAPDQGSCPSRERDRARILLSARSVGRGTTVILPPYQGNAPETPPSKAALGIRSFSAQLHSASYPGAVILGGVRGRDTHSPSG